jgi:hypothetical protein
MSWMHAVTRLPLFANLAIVIVVSVVVAWLAVRLVRRAWPRRELEGSNEMVGLTYAVFGLIYGVLLAYTIVVAWEKFDETEKDAAREATILSELWRNAEAFPAETRAAVHLDLLGYAQSVEEDEWPAMAARGTGAPRTQELYERLWTLSYAIEPQTKGQEAFFTQYLERMNELSSARRLRIMYSTNEVHEILWLVLVIGSVLTVSYTLLFTAKRVWMHTAITAAIMLVALLGLLVIISLQYPFTGDVSVKPEAFHDLANSFRLRMVPRAMLLR